MADIPFLLSYWRPWDENSSFVDSWGDYLRDKSLVDYGTDKLGSFIQQASRENVQAIEEASQKQVKATIASGMLQAKAIQDAANKIGFKLDNVSNELKFLNRRMDIAIEQQRINQLNLEELLRIPDSEKERLKTIKAGVHFFMASSNDPDLFDDALEEFMKALEMKKQDYFVLHKIGCIYLFSQKHLNPEKALDFFIRAGKYAAADSITDSSVGSEKLKGDFNYIDSTSDRKQICLLAADSYDKAALTSYILGDDGQAVHFQELAVKSHTEGKNLFNLAKYLFRIGDNNAIDRLNDAIELDPGMLNAIFCDADIVSSPLIPDFVNQKWAELDNSIEESIISLLQKQNSNNRIDLLRIELTKKAYDCINKKNYAKAKTMTSIIMTDDKTLSDAINKEKVFRKTFEKWVQSTFNTSSEAKPYMGLLQNVILKDAKSLDEFYRNYNEGMAFINNYHNN